MHIMQMGVLLEVMVHIFSPSEWVSTLVTLVQDDFLLVIGQHMFVITWCESNMDSQPGQTASTSPPEEKRGGEDRWLRDKQASLLGK
jgi:hypothetical protein